jgi:hypothetical protein
MLINIKTQRGYHIQASDCKIGHVDDFNIDEETWPIRYLINDTLKWLKRNKSNVTKNDSTQ